MNDKEIDMYIDSIRTLVDDYDMIQFSLTLEEFREELKK